MEKKEREFNQSAASLTPQHFPAQFAMNFETCFFQLPDFSDVGSLKRPLSDRDPGRFQSIDQMTPLSDGSETESTVEPQVDLPLPAPAEMTQNSTSENRSKKVTEDGIASTAEAIQQQPTHLKDLTDGECTHEGLTRRTGQFVPSFQPMDDAFAAVSPIVPDHPGNEEVKLSSVCEIREPEEQVDRIPEPSRNEKGHDRNEEEILSAPPGGFAGTLKPDKPNPVLLNARLEGYQVSCESLLKTIVARRQPARPGVYVICDVDSPLRAGQLSLAIARKLTFLTDKRVLVIDSDLESSALSTWCRIGTGDGTREMIRAMIPWERLVKTTDIPRIDLMICGQQPLRFRGTNEFSEGVVRKSLVQMDETYDFVIVNSGHAFDNSLYLWGQVCDGTCLVLDRERSSRSVSIAAVEELKKMGCRLMGCLQVTSMPEAVELKRKAS